MTFRKITGKKFIMERELFSVENGNFMAENKQASLILKFAVFIVIIFFCNSLYAELINRQTLMELTPAPAPAPKHKIKKRTKRDIIISTASSLIGVDYWPGGEDSEYGYDCSGLTQYSYNAAGISIPRRAIDQYNGAVKLEQNQLKRGDLVFFNTQGYGINHVGIYLGGGRFIHAPGIGREIRIDDFSRPYWGSRFWGGGTYIREDKR
jgi:cell wall-associated NlpC family hydrolase